MSHVLRLLSLLLLSAVFFACQPENPIVEEQPKVENPAIEQPKDPNLGKWMIKRHSIVIMGGAIRNENAGFFDLKAEGKGEASIQYQGSNYAEKHDIEWSFNEDDNTMSIDHLDGTEKEVFKVKDKTDNNQKWQRDEFDSKGNLEKMVEILLEK